MSVLSSFYVSGIVHRWNRWHGQNRMFVA